jgi:hypothetical protein
MFRGRVVNDWNIQVRYYTRRLCYDNEILQLSSCASTITLDVSHWFNAGILHAVLVV